MAYNHGREDRKWRIWKEAEEKLLRECGVDEATIPLSLEGVGAVLGLEKQKLTEGKDLILERQSQRTR